MNAYINQRARYMFMFPSASAVWPQWHWTQRNHVDLMESEKTGPHQFTLLLCLNVFFTLLTSASSLFTSSSASSSFVSSPSTPSCWTKKRRWMTSHSWVSERVGPSPALASHVSVSCLSGLADLHTVQKMPEGRRPDAFTHKHKHPHIL